VLVWNICNRALVENQGRAVSDALGYQTPYEQVVRVLLVPERVFVGEDVVLEVGLEGLVDTEQVARLRADHDVV